jgi:hypothetical protein
MPPPHPSFSGRPATAGAQLATSGDWYAAPPQWPQDEEDRSPQRRPLSSIEARTHLPLQSTHPLHRVSAATRGEAAGHADAPYWFTGRDDHMSDAFRSSAAWTARDDASRRVLSPGALERRAGPPETAQARADRELGIVQDVDDENWGSPRASDGGSAPQDAVYTPPAPASRPGSARRPGSASRPPSAAKAPTLSWALKLGTVSANDVAAQVAAEVVAAGCRSATVKAGGLSPVVMGRFQSAAAMRDAFRSTMLGQIRSQVERAEAAAAVPRPASPATAAAVVSPGATYRPHSASARLGIERARPASRPSSAAAAGVRREQQRKASEIATVRQLM